MRKAKHVGIIVASGYYYSRQVIEGVYAYSDSHGPWEFHVEQDAMRQESYARLKSCHRWWGLDGIIIQLWERKTQQLLRRFDIPVVNVSGRMDTQWPVRVVPDDPAIGAMVARELMDRGFRHFFYLGLPAGYSSDQRALGFKDQLAEKGFTCVRFSPPGLLHRDPSSAQQRKVVIEWLKRAPKPIGAMAANAPSACNLATLCKEANLRVPEDVALISGDDDDVIMSRTLTSISCVDVRPAQIGMQAAALLDRMMHGAAPLPHPVLIAPGGIITRRSSDSTATDNPLVASALRFMRDHAGAGINVNDVLREIPISRRALEISLQKLLHRSPRQQIQLERVSRAATLLRETDLALSQVAKLSGFTRPGSFSTIFKRFEKKSPKDYRKMSRL